jgi:hypothetical protein
MALGITVYQVPNNAILGFIFVLAMLLSVMVIRVLYIIMGRVKHHYPNDEVFLGMVGCKAIRILSMVMLFTVCLLGFRVDSAIPPGKFWELDSLTRGWWCIIRICIAGLCALCATVFETHWSFRLWASVTMPLCSVLDLLSEGNFAVQLSCLDHGLCQPDAMLRKQLYLLAWRDIVSAVLTVSRTEGTYSRPHAAFSGRRSIHFATCDWLVAFLGVLPPVNVHWRVHLALVPAWHSL